MEVRFYMGFDTPSKHLGRVILLSTCPLYTNIECEKREAHINWSMVICKMAVHVAGTTSQTTGPVPADFRQ